jgi:hypothetical protein
MFLQESINDMASFFGIYHQLKYLIFLYHNDKNAANSQKQAVGADDLFHFSVICIVLEYACVVWHTNPIAEQ